MPSTELTSAADSAFKVTGVRSIVVNRQRGISRPPDQLEDQQIRYQPGGVRRFWSFDTYYVYETSKPQSSRGGPCSPGS
jgi:hypothetical protein